MKCPCHGCFRRKLMCHTVCKEYQAWKADREAFLQRRKHEREKDRILDGRGKRK